MADEDGTEPIANAELLYRRIPVSMGWVAGNTLSPEAFRARPEDVTGISLSRAKYASVEHAARGPSLHGYYVAVLRAGDLRSVGIDPSPDPLPDDPGHAEISSLTYANRKSDAAIEQRNRLAGPLCLRVEGPFSGPPKPVVRR